MLVLDHTRFGTDSRQPCPLKSISDTRFHPLICGGLQIFEQCRIEARNRPLGALDGIGGFL